MGKSYSEKLLDPRWQKKRLEILARDNWTCQRCGAVNCELHVHHACRDCHDLANKLLRDFRRTVAELSIARQERFHVFLEQFLRLSLDDQEILWSALKKLGYDRSFARYVDAVDEDVKQIMQGWY